MEHVQVRATLILKGHLAMGNIFDLIRYWGLRARRFLDKKSDQQLEMGNCNELDEHPNSFDRVLLKEYLDLLQALEREEDPIRRHRILSAIADIREMLEK